MNTDQERAIGFRMDRTRREMLAGQEDAFARVEVARRLEIEAPGGFVQRGERMMVSALFGGVAA